MAYLDGIPVGPLILFGLGWLIFLGLVLMFIRSRRTDRCDRCGGRWLMTEKGNQVHLCVLPEMECSSYCLACGMRDGLHAPFCKAFRP